MSRSESYHEVGLLLVSITKIELALRESEQIKHSLSRGIKSEIDLDVVQSWTTYATML